jgi:hypothetical protein
MKIIAATKEGFLAELSTDDITALQGLTSKYHVDYREVKIGFSVSMMKIIHAHHAVGKFFSSNNLAEADRYAKNIQDQVKLIRQMVTGPEVKEPDS